MLGFILIVALDLILIAAAVVAAYVIVDLVRFARCGLDTSAGF